MQQRGGNALQDGTSLDSDERSAVSHAGCDARDQGAAIEPICTSVSRSCKECRGISCTSLHLARVAVNSSLLPKYRCWRHCAVGNCPSESRQAFQKPRGVTAQQKGRHLVRCRFTERPHPECSHALVDAARYTYCHIRFNCCQLRSTVRSTRPPDLLHRTGQQLPPRAAMSMA